VLVSIAILGLGLTAILSAQAGAFEGAAHARNISVATGLLRCKMNEVEEHLYREGFQDTDESGAGPCCEGDENPGMHCTWRADRPQFPEARFGDLDLSAGLNFGSPGGGSSSSPLGALGMLAGLGGPSGAGAPAPTTPADFAKVLADANAMAVPTGATAPTTPPIGSASASSSGGLDPNADGAGAGMGGIASMAMSIVYPSLKILFEASTRRITSTVTFHEGNREYSIEVSEWFAVPQKGLTPTDDPSASATSPTSTTTSTAAKATVGTKSN
jgi:general secretion pathway protein I